MFIWQILSWYIVILQCVDNKYFELLSAVNLSLCAESSSKSDSKRSQHAAVSRRSEMVWS